MRMSNGDRRHWQVSLLCGVVRLHHQRTAHPHPLSLLSAPQLESVRAGAKHGTAALTGPYKDNGPSPPSLVLLMLIVAFCSLPSETRPEIAVRLKMRTR